MTDLRDLSLRAVLFTPATRPDRVAKLPATGADLGIVDLEDAVAPSAKVEARAQAAAACARLLGEGTSMAIAVRVNAPRTDLFAGDVEEAIVEGVEAVVVPKVEARDDVDVARAALDRRGLRAVQIIAGIESAAGVLRCEAIVASGQVHGVYFGAEDYVADLGGERTEEGTEVLCARSQVALVARVHGIVALDQVVPRFDDDEHFQRDAAMGKALGYAGKLCVHPRQVPLAQDAFSPSVEAVERARRLVETYEAALAEGVGVVTFDGQMVDQPMLASARRLLASVRRHDGEG